MVTDLRAHGQRFQRGGAGVRRIAPRACGGVKAEGAIGARQPCGHLEGCLPCIDIGHSQAARDGRQRVFADAAHGKARDAGRVICARQRDGQRGGRGAAIHIGDLVGQHFGHHLASVQGLCACARGKGGNGSLRGGQKIGGNRHCAQCRWGQQRDGCGAIKHTIIGQQIDPNGRAVFGGGQCIGIGDGQRIHRIGWHPIDIDGEPFDRHHCQPCRGKDEWRRVGAGDMGKKPCHIGLEQRIGPFGRCHRQVQFVNACAAVITVIRACIFGQIMAEQIVTRPACKAVAACPAIQRIIARARIGGIGGGIARDIIRAAAQVHLLKLGKGQSRARRQNQPRLAGAKGQLRCGGHRRQIQRVACDFARLAAKGRIGAKAIARADSIIARAAKDCVIAIAAKQAIIARFAIKLVIARLARQVIVALTAKDSVIAAAAQNRVIASARLDRVIASGRHKGGRGWVDRPAIGQLQADVAAKGHIHAHIVKIAIPQIGRIFKGNPRPFLVGLVQNSIDRV